MAAAKNDSAGLLTAGIIAAGIYFVTLEAKKAKSTMYFQNLKVLIGNVKFSGDSMIIELKIENPNTTAQVVRSIVGQVLVNNNPIGDINQYTTYTVRGNNETIIPLVVKLNFLYLLSELTSMIQGKRNQVVLTFNGTINLNNAPTPLQIRYKLSA